MSSLFARRTQSSPMSASLKIMADAIFKSSFVKRKIKKDGLEQNDGVMGGVPESEPPLRGRRVRLERMFASWT